MCFWCVPSDPGVSLNCSYDLSCRFFVDYVVAFKVSLCGFQLLFSMGFCFWGNFANFYLNTSILHMTIFQFVGKENY